MLSDDLQLPYRIGKELLAIEFELGTGNVYRGLVERAVALYSEAIQIHVTNSQTAQSQEDRERSLKGFKYYQLKLKKLLNEEPIQQCLSGKKVNKKKNLIQMEISQSRQNQPEDIKNLMKGFYESSLNQKKIIQKTLQEQNQAVEQRVQQRTRVKSMITKRSVETAVSNSLSEYQI